MRRNTPLIHSKQFANGFTIVELLIVVVVIAILAAITIVSYNGIRQRAEVAAVQTSFQQMSDKFALYLVDHATADCPSCSTVADVLTQFDATSLSSNVLYSNCGAEAGYVCSPQNYSEDAKSSGKLFIYKDGTMMTIAYWDKVQKLWFYRQYSLWGNGIGQIQSAAALPYTV